MTSELPISNDQLLNDFGDAYAAFGQPRIRGRIVGLLLASPEPLSLDGIVEALESSKGPVSVETRQLKEFGLIRSLKRPRDRKVYFEISEHPISLTARRNLMLIKENQKISKTYLETKDLDPIVKRRFQRMLEFHTRLHDLFKEFMDEWEGE
ncbi:MAG: MarR family transcriptional regulator [Candidatus Marinimicrobia bacterium]|nr:MarR family transcriptional regulator [Candidatus Neomarinimicrobiota bacterium]